MEVVVGHRASISKDKGREVGVVCRASGDPEVEGLLALAAGEASATTTAMAEATTISMEAAAAAAEEEEVEQQQQQEEAMSGSHRRPCLEVEEEG